MAIEHTKPSEALYIKLGRGGKYERECIERDQTFRLGYNEISHELCTNGKWDAVLKELGPRSKSPGAATSHKNQIRRFYESDESVLWFTFFGHRL